MSQVPGNGYVDWTQYGNDFSGNAGHDQGFGDYNIDPHLGDNMDQFDLSGQSTQLGHTFTGYEGQGNSRPTSTQPYTNATFAYPHPQTPDQSLGHAQAVSPNGQFISPTRGQPSQVQGSHDFGGHQYSANLDIGSSFAGPNDLLSGGNQAYHGSPFDPQYIPQQGFTNGGPMAPQQHGDYATNQSHHINDSMTNSLHPHAGQLDQAWNRPGSALQYQNGPMQAPQRDNSSFAQIAPFPGPRITGGMSLPPSTEPQPHQNSGGHGHFAVQAHNQRDHSDTRTAQTQWQSPQQPFVQQPSTAYLQQSAPSGVPQTANQPQSGRGTPIQQQGAAPYGGHYSPAPSNATHIPPPTIPPNSSYAQQQQHFTTPQGARPPQSHPTGLVPAPQVAQPNSNSVPISLAVGASSNASRPGPNLPLPRVLPAFATDRVQAQNAQATGSRYVSFANQAMNANNAPKHIRPFNNPLAVDSDRKLGMSFPGKRVLPCEIVYRFGQATSEERRALVKQLKDLLGDPLPAQYRALLKDPDKGVAETEDQDLEETAPVDVRPDDPTEAAAWDAIQIVDLDRVSSDEPVNVRVGQAVAKLGDLIRRHMVPVKSASDELDAARKAKKESSEISRLKGEVVAKIPPLYKAVDAADDKGDSQVLANLGGNQKLVNDLISALRVTNNIGDHNGVFTKAVLRLMSHSKTITDELLSKTIWPKIKQKFLEKGDEEVKELVKEIAKNAAARSALNRDKQLTADGAKASPSSSTQAKPTSTTTKKMAPGDLAKKKPGSSAARVPSDSSSTKRPRDDEPDSRNVKKLATDPAAATSSQATTRVPTTKSNAGPLGSASATQAKPWSGSALLPGKSKPVAKPAPKPAFSKADSNKPDLAKLPSFKKSDPSKAKRPDIAKSDASQASSSKLGALLDEISKPKPAKVAQAAATPDSSSETPETPEERQKRLRKEQRRKLRVSWKEGDELTQVRIFHKDIAEDEGRAVNMIRDARDDRAEGMLLKQGVNLDEEDEEEIPYRPWVEPPSINFAAIPQEKREETFVNRGGNKTIHTPQQEYIAERENRELMVIYTDPADIPSTPKSPPPSRQERDTATPGVSVPNSVANHPEIQQRWNEVAHMGLSWAVYNAMRRKEEQNPSVAPSSRPNIDATALLNNLGSMALQNAGGSSQQYGRPDAPAAGEQPATSASRDAKVYALLTSDKIKNYKDPDPYNPAHPKTHRRHDYSNPEVQKAADAIEAITEPLRGLPFPPTEPPAWLRGDQARVDEWYHGYNKDRQRAHEEHTRNQAASIQAPQPQAAVPNGMSNNPSDMAAILAYYTQNSQPQDQATAQQQAAWAQYYQSMYQQNQPVQQQPAAGQDSQLQSLLAALGSGQQAAPVHPAATNSGTDPQVQALLASLASSSQASQPYQHAQPANIPSANDPNYAAYIMAMAQQWPTAQPQASNNAQSAGVPNYDQQRQQKSHNSGSRSASGAHSGAKSTSSSNSNNIPPHLRGINRDKIGTKPCVFWANGTCNKGDKCTFRHD